MNLYSKFQKKACVFLSVFLLSNCSSSYIISAQSVDAPLKIETRQIDINDIPENRVITLKISIDSNPGFYVLDMVLRKDSRLSYDSNPQQIFANIPQINCSTTKDNDVVSISVPSQQGSALSDNGDMLELNIKLPDNVGVNDFFPVDFIAHYDIFSTAMCLEGQNEYSDCSNLCGGGIQITGSTPPPSTPDTPADPPHQEPEPQQPEEPVHNNDPQPAQDNGSNNNNTPAQQSQTTSSTTTAATAVTTKTTSSAVVTQTTSGKATKTTTAKTTEKTAKSTGSDNTESVTSPTDILKEKTGQKSGFLPAVIAAVSCAVIAASVLIFRKLKKK
ncbi:MAG: hypothetical protein Q4F95_08850 [Oscillospiraceae bacterium]|nr:hypothetical protein [Oscillospiraceae bacterium]